MNNLLQYPRQCGKIITVEMIIERIVRMELYSERMIEIGKLIEALANEMDIKPSTLAEAMWFSFKEQGH